VAKLVTTSSIMRLVMRSKFVSEYSGMAKWFRAHYNQEVRFSSAVKCKKIPQVLTSLLNQRQNYAFTQYFNCDCSMDVHDEAEHDDVSSTISDLSGMSDFSGQEWKPSSVAGPMGWVQRQMKLGVNPRTVLAKILQQPDPASALPEHIDDLTLWKVSQC